MTSEAPFTIRRYAGISLPKSMTVAWYGGGDSQGFPRAWAREGCSFPGEHVRPVGSKLTLLFEGPGGFVFRPRRLCVTFALAKEWGWNSLICALKPDCSLDDLLKPLLP